MVLLFEALDLVMIDLLERGFHLVQLAVRLVRKLPRVFLFALRNRIQTSDLVLQPSAKKLVFNLSLFNLLLVHVLRIGTDPLRVDLHGSELLGHPVRILLHVFLDSFNLVDRSRAQQLCRNTT